MNRVEAIAKIESFKNTVKTVRKELDFNISLIYDNDLLNKIKYVKKVTDYDKGWNDGIWTIYDVLSGSYDNMNFNEFKQIMDKDYQQLGHN